MPIKPVIICLALLAGPAEWVRADALARLKPERLEAVHQAIVALRSQRRESVRAGPLRDYRANLHVHSALSHDSRGTIEEIIAAARAAGTGVLMFTEHPAEHYDFFKDGHRGLRDGVLLIPGAETNGLLAFPRRSLHGVKSGSPQELADLVRRDGGLVFLSHLEERMDWKLRGLTGSEIYNTHADFKDEKKLIAAMRNPLWLFTVVDVFRKYPQESFSALQDYPADYLRRWDQLCAETPHTGVAANDSHQNAGLVIRLAENGKGRLEDALGKKLFELPVTAFPGLETLAKGKNKGDVIFKLVLDPYRVSLCHAGTHLLMPRLEEKDVWNALEAGRAYVAFDWLADAAGFDFGATSATRRYEMGSRLAFENGLKLSARAPLSVTWKLLRHGKIVQEQKGRAFEMLVPESGVYRIEAWLDVAGEAMIWILSNPIYIRPA
jgi:hypothetical protein